LLGEWNVKPETRACLLGSVALLLAATSLQAGASDTFYRWQDERGNPVNSDRPPPAGTPYEIISTESSMVRRVNSADAPPGKSGDGGEGEAPNQTVVYRGQSQVEKNPEFCAQARENLATLEVAPRVRLRGDDGEYRYLTDEEREEQKKNARDTIAVHCE
jgi:hypothetical protein